MPSRASGNRRRRRARRARTSGAASAAALESALDAALESAYETAHEGEAHTGAGEERGSSRSRRLVRTGIVVGVLAAMFAGGALVALSQAGMSPAWWRRLRPGDERVVRTATSIENQLGRALHGVRTTDEWIDEGARRVSEPWAIEVSELDASRWLTGRLPRWLEMEMGLDEWPEGLSQMQVRFEDGRVRVGLRLGAGAGDPGSGRVVTASLDPVIRGDGSLWVEPRWVHVGRLPLPAGPVLRRARSRAGGLLPEDAAGVDPALVERVFDVLMGREPVNRTPEIRLLDDRSVRLLDLRVRDGTLRAVLRTEARAVAAR